jgi:hypothetical protein
MRNELTLKSFDGRLINGFVFCRKVYDCLNQIQRSPDGKNKIRLRKDGSKKLIEELIPIARYIQFRYSPGRRLKVRWIDGGQQYDAILLSSGPMVDFDLAPRCQHLEVTVAAHELDYLRRELISQGRPVFGVKGLKRDKKTRRIESEPVGRNGDELEVDLTARILASIRAKDGKQYPPGTVLIIDCVQDTVLLRDEWERAINQVRDTKISHRFAEVFITDSGQGHSSTL